MVKKNSVPMQLHSYPIIYVDDGLKSVPTVSEAIHLIKASQGICEKACLRLHKTVSSKKEALEAIPAEDYAKGIKELNLAVDPLPIERALGVMWCVKSHRPECYWFGRHVLTEPSFSMRGIIIV